MSLSAQVLDFYDDLDRSLMSKLAMPDEVRTVEFDLLSFEKCAALSDTNFGLVVLTKQGNKIRKFPVNDPGNACLSARYFDVTHEKLAMPARFVAAKFIKEACIAYDVPASVSVDAYAKKASDVTTNVYSEAAEPKWMLQKMAQDELLVKRAEAMEIEARLNIPDEHFALVVQSGDGDVIRKYAMPTIGHVKKAVTYFDKYARDLHPDHRRQYAVSVTRRAEELGVDVSDSEMLGKYASDTWNPMAHMHIAQRKSLVVHNDEARDALDKLASMLGQTEPAEMAAALRSFDEANCLSKHYDRHLSDPYASTMQKSAEAYSTEIDGRIITADDLRNVSTHDRLKKYLGEDAVKQLQKNPVTVFESLPSPEKVLIKEVIEGA